MKTAKAIKDTILVTSYSDMGIETPCRDYEVFANLPVAVTFEDKEYVITGWDSDIGRAYYKTGIAGRGFARAKK